MHSIEYTCLHDPAFILAKDSFTVIFHCKKEPTYTNF